MEHNTDYKDEIKTRAILLISMAIAIGLIGFIVGFLGGILTTYGPMHTEAVVHRAAHWEVSPDGKTTFKWNQ